MIVILCWLVEVWVSWVYERVSLVIVLGWLGIGIMCGMMVLVRLLI